MGLPALKHNAAATRAPRPRLAVVRPVAKPARKRSAAAQAQAARSLFRTFALIVMLVAILGIGRVWLSVQAAQASLSSSDLQAQIKSERYEGDLLEVRRSALGSPSRIRTIAGKAMGMAPVGKVTYLDISSAGSKPAPVVATVAKAPVPQRADVSAFDATLSKILDLTAGEAQALLVGDVGVASAK